ALTQHIVASRGFIASSELDALVGRPHDSDGYTIDPAFASALAGRAREALRTFHIEQPLEAGMPIEALRASLDVPSDLLREMLPRWEVAVDGANVQLPDHAAATMTTEQRNAANRA